ncbi:uncharacterized protein LTR77_011212 [Saxophila tyrrhenica]|uniref:SnoaL-like domain-containing protein n=1 Tax=Saxophila tyrrhenica TaxID=1690608 RepID=A0AAV9NT36_9PEZI|nr:hypothetical protein LTR77_011212 [Saxophila tyrrhenica]
MSYVTAQTVWMTPTPSSIQDLLQDFFVIADTPDPEAGNLWADRVFQSDASLVTSQGAISGEQAIRNSRKHAWDAIKSRKHFIRRAYAGGQNAEDIMIHGDMHATIRSTGQEISVPFAARFVVGKDSIGSGKPKLSSYEVWADSAPLASALQQANAK